MLMIRKILLLIGAMLVVSVYAADPAPPQAANIAATACTGHNFGTIACNIMESFSNITTLIKAIAYLAGTCFFVVSIFKFKQHKDNPTQIPVGTPIAYMCVAIALIFLPQLMTLSGNTFFGDEPETGENSFMGDGVQPKSG